MRMQMGLLFLLLLTTTLKAFRFSTPSLMLRQSGLSVEDNAESMRDVGLRVSKDRGLRGPGETDREPFSTAKVSKIELAKVVVTTAILYITLQLNIEKAIAKWLPDGLGARNVKSFEDGIKFEDIVVGNGDEICAGDEFEAELTLFYNGLKIDNDANYLMRNQNDTKNIIATYRQDAPEKPIAAIMRGMMGLRVGGRRKIVLAPEHAFGDQGLSPYIPPDAKVLYDVKLVKIYENVQDGAQCVEMSV